MSWEKTAEEEFKKLDKDGSGFIEVAELKSALAELAKSLEMDPPTDQETVECLKIIDKDDSGKVDMNEFKAFMKSIKDQMGA